MSRKRAIDYIEEELKSISTRIRPFIELGYFPEELRELVDAMCRYEKELVLLKKKEQKKQILS